MKHVVQYSGGVGSWATANRVISKHGREDVVLLFADVKMEDEDLYRFLDETEQDLGVPITRISEGRDPWQVFNDVRYLGNTRIDPCSKILKRDFLRAYIEEHYPPKDTVIYLGIDWSEEHRLVRARPLWEPYRVEAPMCDPPHRDKDWLIQALEARGIKVPRLYTLGFPHNNCGGFCIKQGQAGFKKLWEEFPERYAYHERKEQEIREHLDKDVAILRDRRGGTTKPLTLKALRERFEAETDDTDPFDLGGCGCAL